jgi:hypothetical protein
MLGLGALTLSFLSACSPTTEGVGDGGSEDFSLRSRDMLSCEAPAGSLLMNGGFEAPTMQAANGNGQARNTGNPASTIPSWDGCCNQASGGTTWTVITTMPRCGTRAVSISSSSATDNVLNQSLDLRAHVGRSYRLVGWFFVSQAMPAAGLQLDVFNFDTSAVAAASSVLTQGTADWTPLMLTGTVPAGGRLQARITTSGTLSAVADDLFFTLE